MQCACHDCVTLPKRVRYHECNYACDSLPCCGESLAVICFWHDSPDTVNRFHITMAQRDAAPIDQGDVMLQHDMMI